MSRTHAFNESRCHAMVESACHARGVIFDCPIQATGSVMVTKNSPTLAVLTALNEEESPGDYGDFVGRPVITFSGAKGDPIGLACYEATNGFGDSAAYLKVEVLSYNSGTRTITLPTSYDWTVGGVNFDYVVLTGAEAGKVGRITSVTANTMIHTVVPSLTGLVAGDEIAVVPDWVTNISPDLMRDSFLLVASGDWFIEQGTGDLIFDAHPAEYELTFDAQCSTLGMGAGTPLTAQRWANGVRPHATLGHILPAFSFGGSAGFGGAPPYVHDIASGTLLTGLSLNASTGVISGVAAHSINAGGQISETIVLRVTDSNGIVSKRTLTLFQQGFVRMVASGSPSLPPELTPFWGAFAPMADVLVDFEVANNWWNYPGNLTVHIVPNAGNWDMTATWMVRDEAAFLNVTGTWVASSATLLGTYNLTFVSWDIGGYAAGGTTSIEVL